MSAMAYQITGVSIVYSTICSGVDKKKHQSSTSLFFVGGNSTVSGEFPVQRASNAQKVSVWWRHHQLRHPMGLLDILALKLTYFNNIVYWHNFGRRIRSLAPIDSTDLDL